MSARFPRDDPRVAIPLTRICPDCQEDMELITADDVGEVLVYECPECGSQEEIRVENESEDDETGALLGPDVWLDEEGEPELEGDQEDAEDAE
jgi:rubredoxin